MRNRTGEIENRTEMNFYRDIVAFVREDVSTGLFFLIDVNISLVIHLCVERIA